MPATIVSPGKGFTLLDNSQFLDPATVSAEVILTFDSDDEEGNSQEFYSADVVIDLSMVDMEAIRTRTATDALCDIEIDVVGQILEGSTRKLSDLVKISLCYSDGGARAGHEALVGIMEYLCRSSAKYFFQPNQRDPHEQAIVDAYGIARDTAPFNRAA